MEVVIGIVVYLFIGAFVHGAFPGKGDFVSLMAYATIWPLILTSMFATWLRERIRR